MKQKIVNNPTVECKICQEQAKNDLVVRVYEDELWLVRHSQETNILGYFIIEPKRHFLDLSEATAPESAQYGLLLSKVMKAIRASVDCQRVYTFSLAEMVPHFHVHVIPRGANLPRAYVGRGIMSYPVHPSVDQNLMESMCLTMRKALVRLG